MAQPAIAMAGSTASRASDFPNDHPAILMAAPSPGGTGDCRAAHEKSPTAFPVRLLSRLPLYGSRRSSTITQGEMVSCQLDNIAAAARPGMELRMHGR